MVFLFNAHKIPWCESFSFYICLVRYQNMHKKHLYIFLLLLAFSLNAQDKTFKKQLDSIQKLRELSWNDAIDLETRINYAKDAVALSKKTGVDSVFLKSIRVLSMKYMEDVNYYDEAKTILTKNLKLANRLIDSVNVGYMSHQLGYIHQVIKNNDSAYYYYYNALKYFENKKTTRKTKMDIITQAYTYNNIANLQKD